MVSFFLTLKFLYNYFISTGGTSDDEDDDNNFNGSHSSLDLSAHEMPVESD